MHLKTSGGVDQLAVVNIHQELEMAEEICTKNSMHNICDNNHLTEDASEAQVQGERTLLKCGNA